MAGDASANVTGDASTNVTGDVSTRYRRSKNDTVQAFTLLNARRLMAEL